MKKSPQHENIHKSIYAMLLRYDRLQSFRVYLRESLVKPLLYISVI